MSYIQCHTNIYHPKTPSEIIESGKEWNEDEIKKQRYIKFKTEGNRYIFEFVVDNKKIRYVDVMVDYMHMARFKVKFTE